MCILRPTAANKWIPLDLTLNCLHPIAFHSKPLLFMVLLHGHWHWFLDDFEYAGEIQASNDSIQVCPTRLRQKAGVGEHGWSEVELCCEFNTTRREDFLAKSVDLGDEVCGRLPSVTGGQVRARVSRCKHGHGTNGCSHIQWTCSKTLRQVCACR